MSTTQDVETAAQPPHQEPQLPGTGGGQAPRPHAPQVEVGITITSILRAFLLVAVMVWQGSVLRRYSPTMGALVFTGRHTPLNTSCESIFVVLSWSFFLSLVVVVLNMSLALINLVPACLAVRDLVKFWMKTTTLLEAVVASWGVIVIGFQVRETETKACAELYHCAWWCFVGFVLLPLLVVFISCFFLAGFATGAAAAQEAGARQAPIGGGTYGSVTPQQRPNAGVTPFSGRAHRLSASGDESPTSTKGSEVSPGRPQRLAEGGPGPPEAAGDPEAAAQVGEKAADPAAASLLTGK